MRPCSSISGLDGRCRPFSMPHALGGHRINLHLWRQCCTPCPSSCWPRWPCWTPTGGPRCPHRRPPSADTIQSHMSSRSRQEPILSPSLSTSPPNDPRQQYSSHTICAISHPSNLFCIATRCQTCFLLCALDLRNALLSGSCTREY